MAPVRLGVARPTAPFNLSTSNSDLLVEELFSVDPLAPKAASTSTSASARSRSRTRSLTVENLRASRNHQQSQAAANDNIEAAQAQAVGDDNDLDDVAGNQNDQPMQQDLDNEDSMGGVNEAADAADGGNVEMDASGLDNPDNEDQHSDMDLDYLAESESDSETENEAADGQNANSNEAAGAGGQGQDRQGQNEVFFSDEDTGESSHGEEDESEAGETDEQDGDEFSFGLGGPPEELLERRSSGPLGSLNADRANLAPQSMQWAIRPRTKGRTTGGNVTGNGGFIYIDPASLRRTTTANAVAAAAAAAAVAGGGSSGGSEATTMSTTAAALSRAFGLVVRTIADLVTSLQDYGPLTPPLNRMLDIPYSEAVGLQMMIENTLKPNWDWLMTVLDSTEAQLRFGSALASATDPSQPGHPLHARSASTLRPSLEPPVSRGFSTSRAATSLASLAGNAAASASAALAASASGGLEPASSRRDFLSYALSLMRSHNAEHSDSLPILDVASMKHMAYVFDALIYYIRSGNLDLKATAASASVTSFVIEDFSSTSKEPEPEEDSNSSEATTSAAGDSGRKHTFFQRSDSTLCLGCPPPDPFATTSEAIPLAEQPQLLQPNARREELFGSPKQPLNAASGSNPLAVLPTKLGLTSRTSENALEFQPQRATSPTAATCDTASVRSMDTEINEPQDLSMGGLSATSSLSDR